MRCKNCHYSLDGLTEKRCPECGREFDPNDPNTFDSPAPVGIDFRSAAIGSAITFIAAFLIMLVASAVWGLRGPEAGGAFMMALVASLLAFPCLLVASGIRCRVAEARKQRD